MDHCAKLDKGRGAHLNCKAKALPGELFQCFQAAVRWPLQEGIVLEQIHLSIACTATA